jgi:drug/metabolite transporter (DMT)-like permease
MFSAGTADRAAVQTRMSLVALLLLLGAALSHATWNYIAKGARNSLALTFAIVVCSVVLYFPVALAVFVWTQPSLDARALGFMLVSGLLHTVYFYLLNQGYRVGDLSLIYPLSRGTGPALAVAGAVLIYDERPTPIALAGIVLVIGGVLVLSAPRRFTAETLGASLAFSIATGASIAAYTL